MGLIADNLQAVKARIGEAARCSGRAPESVRLLAVSKTWPAAMVREAADAGQRAFGENYVQEGAGKAAELADLALEWHFIGLLQANKTRQVAERFDWVHSIDRFRIAERLAAQRPAAMLPLNVCIQVNISGEITKSGCAPEDAAEIARGILALPGLRLRGLMAIPAPTQSGAAQRAPFARLRALFESLRTGGAEIDTLSMGMSHDLEAAVAEGATIVRVGTAIFGERRAT